MNKRIPWAEPLPSASFAPSRPIFSHLICCFLEVTVVEEITLILLERLRAATIDLAILALHPRPRIRDFSDPLAAPFRPARDSRIIRVRARQHSLSLKDLRSQPFLPLRDGHCFRDAAVAACDRARLHPQIVFESGQFSSLLSMVSVSMGVSEVPEMAIDKKSHCAFVRLADDQATRTIGAARLRGRSFSRAHSVFLSLLRSE